MMQLRTATPTARKAHRCDWCFVVIEPGTKYHRSTNIYDDRVYDWVACVECNVLCPEVWEWAWRPDEDVGEDEFQEWADAHREDEQVGEQARAYLTRRRGPTTPEETS